MAELVQPLQTWCSLALLALQLFKTVFLKTFLGSFFMF